MTLTVVRKNIIARTSSGEEYTNSFGFYSHEEIMRIVFSHFKLSVNNITKTGDDKYMSECGVLVTIKYK